MLSPELDMALQKVALAPALPPVVGTMDPYDDPHPALRIALPEGGWPEGGLVASWGATSIDQGRSFALPESYFATPEDLRSALNHAFDAATHNHETLFGMVTVESVADNGNGGQEVLVLGIGDVNQQDWEAMRHGIETGGEGAFTVQPTALVLTGWEQGQEPLQVEAPVVRTEVQEQRSLDFGLGQTGHPDAQELSLTVDAPGLAAPVTLTATLEGGTPEAALADLAEQITGVGGQSFTIFPDLVREGNTLLHQPEGQEGRPVDWIYLDVYLDGAGYHDWVYASVHGDDAEQLLSQLTVRDWIVSAEILAEGGLRVVLPEDVPQPWVYAGYEYRDGSDQWQWVSVYQVEVEPIGTPPHPELGPLFADVAVSGQSLVFTMAEPGVSEVSLAGAVVLQDPQTEAQTQDALPEGAETVLVAGRTEVAGEVTPLTHPLEQAIDAEAQAGRLAFDIAAGVAQDAAAAADLVQGFELARDMVLFDGALAEALRHGPVDWVAAATDGDLTSLNLSLTEFALVDQTAMQAAGGRAVAAADLGDAARVASALEWLFETAVLWDGPPQATVFAVTAADDASQTALWLHMQETASDLALAPGLTHLATLHTLPGDGAEAFSAANIGFVEDLGHGPVGDV